MFVLDRILTRRTGTAITPSGRPVQKIPGFDTALPAEFPTPDTTAVTADILGQLQKLTANNAADGAHAAVLDSLTAAAMAPFFHAATVHLSTSLRIIQQLDQQAIEVATTAFERAKKAAEDADQAERQADAAYHAHVGLDRIRSTYCESTDWDALQEKLRQHHLVLTADPETVAFVHRGFRYDDRDLATHPADEPATTDSQNTPATSSDAKPPLKPLNTNHHPAYTTERH